MGKNKCKKPSLYSIIELGLPNKMDIEEWVTTNISLFKIRGSENLTVQNLDQVEYTSRYDLRTWAQGLTESVGLIHAPSVPPDTTSGKRMSYSHGEADETCYVCTFTFPLTVKGTVVNNWLFISGNNNFTADIRNLPYPGNCVVHALQKGSFPVLKKSALAVGGNAAVAERVVFTVVCDDYELIHLLQSGKIKAEMGLMAVIYNLYPYARAWLTINTTVIGYQEAVGKLGLGQVDVHEGTNKSRNDYFLVRTTLYLLGASYTQNERVADQLQRRGQSAAKSMSTEFPEKTAVSSEITSCAWEVPNRTGTMDDALARILAIDKNGEFNIDVATDDLRELQDMKDAKSVSDWGIALLEQARLVYANSHAKSLAMALSVRPLIHNLMQKLGHSWKVESDRLAVLETETRDKPFTGLRGKLPEARQVNQWKKHAHIGINYHKSTLTDPKKIAEFEKYKLSAIEQKIESAAEVQTCYTILKAIPKTAILGLVALIKNVPLSEARDIIDNEKPEIKSAVLKRLLSDKVDCPWSKFYKSELVKIEMHRVKQQADSVIDQVIKKKIESLTAMSKADPNKETGFNNRYIIANLEDHLRKEALGDSPLAETIKSPEDAVVQDDFNKEIVRLEKLIISIQSHTYRNMTE